MRLAPTASRTVTVFVEGADEQHLIGQFSATGKERGQGAGGNEIVGATEIGNDRLLYRAINPVVFDYLHVGARSGLFDTEEHRGLSNEAPRNPIRE